MIEQMTDKKRIENAEKKYRELIEQRDKLNDESKLIRDERDNINKIKKELLENIKKEKELRDKLVAEMKIHKQLRDECHKKAKELIKDRKQRKGIIKFDIQEQLIDIRERYQELELKQQTEPMSIKKEKKLIEEIRKCKNEWEKLENEVKEQEKTSIEISEIGKGIDELFKKADAEHQEVIRLAKDAQIHHENMNKMFIETSHLINEPNKKHKEYLVVRAEGEKLHKKIVEMRTTIIAYRKELWLKRAEEKKILDDHKKSVKIILENKKEIEKKIDETIEQLKTKGKVVL